MNKVNILLLFISSSYAQCVKDKCTDNANDCCAEPEGQNWGWNEPQTCQSGYYPNALNTDCYAGYKGGYECCPDSSASGCVKDKCTDWGNDCCGSDAWGEPQTC
jgi:hypothetical protein